MKELEALLLHYPNNIPKERDTLDGELESANKLNTHWIKLDFLYKKLFVHVL